MSWDKRVRAIRAARAETQEQFARWLDVCVRTVKGWEGGRIPDGPTRLLFERIEADLQSLPAR